MALVVFAALVIFCGLFVLGFDIVSRGSGSPSTSPSTVLGDIAIAVLLGPFIMIGLSFMLAFAVLAAPVMLPMILVWSHEDAPETERGRRALRPATV